MWLLGLSIMAIRRSLTPVENIGIWGEMISNFKERGLEQVELFLSDGFVGIKDMLKQYYPKSKFQRCLVMRNIKGKVRVSDRKEALDDFKQVHKQSSLKEAETNGSPRFLRQIRLKILKHYQESAED